ncbi:calcium-binding protein [Amaricoccus macauensis]|uniref:calcium-binding protein n=1 Tax=Amaricoccus macauensis TaxID=57001 RepID=UPI003C7DBDF2
MSIQGTAGPDVLDGTSGGEIIEGLAGDDLIRGNRGRDSLEGGRGNDTLDGGGGTDTLDGGQGSDTADYRATTVSVLVGLDPDGWYDQYDGTWHRWRYTEDAASQLGGAYFPGTGWDSETLIGIENVRTGSGDDSLYGDLHDNLLDGGTGDDYLSGGLGIDTLVGGMGNDTVVFFWEEHFSFYGDAGWDWEYDYVDVSAHVIGQLTADGGSLRIRGDALFDWDQTPIDIRQDLSGIENLSTGYGDDELHGNSAANQLSSGAGNDLLRGGGGKDTLLGGEGDDTLDGGGGTDELDGGDGFDVADYSATGVDMQADLAQQRISFPGRNWNPEVLTAIEGVITGSGDDLLHGTAQSDFLGGSGGNDTLHGYGGDDTLDAGYGTDRLFGGNGSDTADYSSVGHGVKIRIGAQLGEIYNFGGGLRSRDKFASIENGTGGSGNDTLLGNSAANTFDGGLGDDYIEAREGDDTLLLSSGNDTIVGGSGNDTLVIDHSDGFLGSATFKYEGMERGVRSWIETDHHADSYVNLTTGVIRAGGGFSGVSHAEQIETVLIRAGWGDDTVIGSDADNEIHVGHGANFVEGKRGDDIIYGGSSAGEDYSDLVDDIVWGTFAFDYGSQDEELYGNQGNDTLHGSGFLHGGEGDDHLIATDYGPEITMTGGNGADMFEFSGRTKDIPGGYYPMDVAMLGRITDFDPGEGDQIAINGRSPHDWNGHQTEVEFWQDGADTILYYANEDYGNFDDIYGLTITLENYAGSLSESDIVFV